jgi:hypothetical protein
MHNRLRLPSVREVPNLVRDGFPNGAEVFENVCVYAAISMYAVYAAGCHMNKQSVEPNSDQNAIVTEREKVNYVFQNCIKANDYDHSIRYFAL